MALFSGHRNKPPRCAAISVRAVMRRMVDRPARQIQKPRRVP
jgi:hypothetical protein